MIVVAVRCKRLIGNLALVAVEIRLMAVNNPALVAVGNPALVAVGNPALVAVGNPRASSPSSSVSKLWASQGLFWLARDTVVFLAIVEDNEYIVYTRTRARGDRCGGRNNRSSEIRCNTACKPGS
jgi:hypothetical protein